jgi:RNA polymerase sigma-70 factor (ECF subfamily)
VATSHAADLELARRCAAGDPAAWDQFVLEYRPVLYRAADALDASGRAREVADSLYAELYGIKDANGERQSLFRYFQGRSRLGTWLRAVLAQRYVDVVRAGRRLEPLPDDQSELRGVAMIGAGAVDAGQPDLERPRYVSVIRAALARTLARLGDRDRLRLACYYVQQLTLAEIGRALEEHEATVSRQLARTRRAIRRDVERELRAEAGFTDRQIAECFSSIAADPGPLDLAPLLGAAHRNDPARGRSL